MLDVFITVDTEISLRARYWNPSNLAREMARDVFAVTPQGEFGIVYQMDLLNAHGLKAVFFVEPLFASVVGLDPLRRIVAGIQGRGHEVQLHLHTEWLSQMTDPVLPGRTGYNIKDFSEDEQAALIARGLANLKEAGAQNICAFRAGNFGANFDTLRALCRNGILYDSSYNIGSLDSNCGLRTPDPLLQPKQLHGVVEFPVTFFRDGLGRYRPAQLCACSSREMETALLGAWQRGWSSFVLVSHSFELIKRNHQRGETRADPIVIRRFEKLCRFLAEHRDKFRTRGFSEISPGVPPEQTSGQLLRVAARHTARRLAEQLVRRAI